MAFRMQRSVPELTHLEGESEATYALYGPDVQTPGTFASNCLLARRLIERDVRCKIFHRGWDHHGNLPRDLPLQCQDIDQASSALIQDLKQRGLLEDTLVVWGGEFGRINLSPRQIGTHQLRKGSSPQMLYHGWQVRYSRHDLWFNRRFQLQY